MVVALAPGVPPRGVVDVLGTESWALFQAAMLAPVGCRFRVDCKPVVDAIHKGKRWATAAQRPLARVHGLMSTALDEVDVKLVASMPAHSRPHQAGVLLLSNGAF